jgi:nucleotide sugar dehydrogenase
MKSIAIIGQGFVGGSLTTVFAERGFDVYAYDKAGKYATGSKVPPPIFTEDEVRSGFASREHGAIIMQRTGGYDVVDHCPKSVTQLVTACSQLGKAFSGVYFVCVPTPMFESGEADLTIVEGVLSELAMASSAGPRIAVIKSTVPPGSCERWNKQFNNHGLAVVFNPEFLTEANALDDMRNQNRIILGGPRPQINKVKQVFEAAFPSVPIIKTSSSTAEMVKYVTNIHLAVKVSLANEFYQICEALDAKGANIDYDKVVEYSTMDARLGKSHWKVPGPMPADDTGEPAYGFGGSCFAKDINALRYVARRLGIDPKVMDASWAKNLEVRPQRDWEKLIGRAVTKKSAK